MPLPLSDEQRGHVVRIFSSRRLHQRVYWTRWEVHEDDCDEDDEDSALAVALAMNGGSKLMLVQ